MSLYEALAAVLLVVFILTPVFASLMGHTCYEDDSNHSKAGDE